MKRKREPQRLVLEMQQLIYRHDITRKELAQRAGLGDNTIGEWINNGVKPTIESFDMALKVLGCKLKIVEDNEEEDHHE